MVNLDGWHHVVINIIMLLLISLCEYYVVIMIIKRVRNVKSETGVLHGSMHLCIMKVITPMDLGVMKVLTNLRLNFKNSMIISVNIKGFPIPMATRTPVPNATRATATFLFPPGADSHTDVARAISSSCHEIEL
jgi:hypothetical protein